MHLDDVGSEWIFKLSFEKGSEIRGAELGYFLPHPPALAARTVSNCVRAFGKVGRGRRTCNVQTAQDNLLPLHSA